jgi:phosphopentomutase
MRVFLVVLDGVGAGWAPDAAEYGDVGADTLGHVMQAENLHLPEFAKLGLYNITGTSFYRPERAEGAFGKMMELSKGKDTTTGHWEMAGIVLDKPFPTYPNGFPKDVIDEFTRRTGRGVLGNCAASGTEIIKVLGAEHVRTGKPIVYTSADSVFQVAAHEEVIPLEELYHICREAREMLTGGHAVDRVIARPFIGEEGAYTRTENRRDFSLPPPKGHLLDRLYDGCVHVTAIGKILDIFAGRSMNEWIHSHNNTEGLDAILACMQGQAEGLFFANLVDFDMLYGHRNDAAGFASALMEVDGYIPKFRQAMRDGDVLFFTADHGCDPTSPSTDHNREYVPLLAWGKSLKQGVDLGVRHGFGDLGQTVADLFGIPAGFGQSFLGEIKGA